MKTLLVLTLLALAVAAIPVATADHPPSGCAGYGAVAAVCTWHHGPYDCYYFVLLGEHQQNMDTC